MKKNLKEKIVGKHESRKDLFKDIVACVIIVYVAVLAFLFVDSKITYINAQTEFISNQIQVQHSAAQMME